MLSDEKFYKKQQDWADCNFIEAALGYAIKAMFWADLDKESIENVVKYMKYFLETDSVDVAERSYLNSDFRGLSFIPDEM